MGAATILVTLAGQPNCGKSTVFNALTGARQHVANYPGVTVEKMTGWYRRGDTRVEVVDLPGIYSLTSYSPEERVTRDFLLHQRPSVCVNVMDAANLKRCLYLTFQLLEMEAPVVLNLNMMDRVAQLKMGIDTDQLSQRLGIAVVPTTIKNGRGKQALWKAIDIAARQKPSAPHVRIHYGEMERPLERITKALSDQTSLAERFPLRWLAIKLMEGDAEAVRLLRQQGDNARQIRDMVDAAREEFEDRFQEPPDLFIANRRYQAADDIARHCITGGRTARPFSDRLDQVVCHRLLGPIMLVGIIWLLYYLAIVQGYNLTNYTWPLLAKLRNLVEAAAPAPGFIDIPLLRSFSLWITDSINALFNYVPIFFILFGLIALLEDSGYMPRMAFIMDRLFSRFGLHGQSTLPMVLGGIYVGGCAVPGIMACKGIPDERSRLATILIIPMLNCLAKVPLYVLLINIYFAGHKALAMFFISTISLLLALPISKILTLTVLRKKDTAPFVMEMPPYHLPTLRGVLGRAVERVWLFIRKITTIVVAVAVVVFALLQFPGISKERRILYVQQKNAAVSAFFATARGTVFADGLQKHPIMDLVQYGEAYKAAKMTAGNATAAAAVDARFQSRNPLFYRIVQPGDDKAAKKVSRALRKLVKQRKGILREMRRERIENSFLGLMGKGLEPITQWAGFNWRVNVALLSALAAKESAVATLGSLYEQEEEGEDLETRMERGEAQFTPLHALALMLFMVLYPPCMATAIAVNSQAGAFRWMLFSIGYPMLLGVGVATLVFTGGSALHLTGLQAMGVFYALALGFTLLMGAINNNPSYHQSIRRNATCANKT